jgi:fatty acid-binding protein DegV
MPPVAIVTDSASDLPPDLAAALGIRVVPLLVRFGTQEFRAGVDLSAADFWTRMLAPDAPFPTTAARSRRSSPRRSPRGRNRSSA